jgi:hypothetical protein
MTLAACAKTTTHLTPISSTLAVHASMKQSARSCSSRNVSPRREGRYVEAYDSSIELGGNKGESDDGEAGRGWSPVSGTTVEYLS